METENKRMPEISEPTGGLLVWIVIFIELITFGIALLFFVMNGKEDLLGFHKSALSLNKTIAFMNTMVLLTSGYTMALSIDFFKRGTMKKFKSYLLFTIILGTLFVVLKLFEYFIKYQQHISLDTNPFYTYYYMLTAFHLFHVLFGIILLGYFYTTHSDIKLNDIEATASFWHMCDLIWLLIFPFIYLLY
ncbi:MAG: cytochrome c oxidase subunit 3 [Bacteroidetes bacterium]|nr:cytochrome c oxidase subunit 3 [Bacteroidota bacterium]HQW45444.1 cytochrome c oxidase subunit 3 [Chitinophagaceae bacterium]MBK6818579.1 cytochrome c oxidase subunit 3 [Bacteroidota bacterium]MBK7041241.1 cytochrome c oxidase subunit 3 [Bacteroidota bacterium]MBK7588624.1 cytochrome c oxidase subunit 3 [Bacteroidota bacterium]